MDKCQLHQGSPQQQTFLFLCSLLEPNTVYANNALHLSTRTRTVWSHWLIRSIEETVALRNPRRRIREKCWTGLIPKHFHDRPRWMHVWFEHGAFRRNRPVHFAAILVEMMPVIGARLIAILAQVKRAKDPWEALNFFRNPDSFSAPYLFYAVASEIGLEITLLTALKWQSLCRISEKLSNAP